MSLRLLWKLHRFELAALLVIASVLTVLAVVATVRMVGAPEPEAECMAHWEDMAEILPGCDSLRARVQARGDADRVASMVPYPMLLMSLLLGTVIVGREVESRTSQLAWSVSGRRGRWLARRVMPLGLILLGCLVAVALTSDLLFSAQYELDPLAAFTHYADRGVALLLRGLALFAVAVLVGAIIGRQLPAFIIAGAIAVGLTTLVTQQFPLGVPGTWVEATVYQQLPGTYYDADAVLQQGIRFPDGTIIPSEFGGGSATSTAVIQLIWGSELPWYLLREAVVFLGVAGLSLVGARIVVDRRRPE